MKNINYGSFNLGNQIDNNAISDLVNNPFFEEFDWISLENKTMQAYYFPKIKNYADTSNFAHYVDDSYENLLDYAFEND